MTAVGISFAVCALIVHENRYASGKDDYAKDDDCDADFLAYFASLCFLRFLCGCVGIHIYRDVVYLCKRVKSISRTHE